MKLGAFDLTLPLMLAPMAGFSDLPFRETAREFGADYAVAEMTASREDLRSRSKSLTRWVEPEETGIRVVQLLGADPEVMAAAARSAEESGADIVDINMGCPTKKVLHAECGSALMKNEKLVAAILGAVVGAVNIPVTLKIRTGWDREHRNAPLIAKIAEDAGVGMLVIHGRTRADGFQGEAEYETISRVKSERGIPIVANGDIDCAAKALEVLRVTGADGLMIGRAAVGRPWIFSEIRAALEGREAAAPDARQVLAHLLHHRARHFVYYGARRGMRTFRKHLRAYLKPFPDPSNIVAELLRADDADVELALIEKFFRAAEGAQA